MIQWSIVIPLRHARVRCFFPNCLWVLEEAPVCSQELHVWIIPANHSLIARLMHLQSLPLSTGLLSTFSGEAFFTSILWMNIQLGQYTVKKCVPPLHPLLSLICTSSNTDWDILSE